MTRGREELRMGFQEEVEAFAGGFLGRSDNARQLCEELANCTDIMPTETCQYLGVEPGSTYGGGAKEMNARLWEMESEEGEG
jgi:hypothetical protein